MRVISVSLFAALLGCGDDASKCALPFADGDPNGHPDPLGSSITEARAGRIRADQLPAVPSGLVTWADGDFVLANDRVALVIEDAGDSDLYDPWGGRPVGLARVESGKLVEPNNFGEFFVLTGRSTVVTEAVSVISDGSDGGPAIVRARGKLHPLPFFESLTAILYNDEYMDIEAAIDYVLEPGADHVEIRFVYHSSRSTETKVPSTMHGLMYSGRTAPTVFQPVKGFEVLLANAPYVGFVEDQATSWAYMPGEGTLGSSLAASGFLGAFGPGYTIPSCGTDFERVAAKIVIAGPGLDPLQAAASKLIGVEQREVTGTVTRGGAPLAGVHVHALLGDEYVTRTTTDSAGNYTLHAPAGNLTLMTYTRTDGLQATTDLPATGTLHVVATESNAAVPVRVQVLGSAPAVESRFGEPPLAGGRVEVAYPENGDYSLV
jgi:hypothetical protein